MIQGTESDCRIKNISISESTATITLLVFAAKNTLVPKPFYVCLRDENGTEKIRLDSKTYWIDKMNGYNSDSNNVNINKYKEIMVDIDITNGGEGTVSGNHWVRSCYIVLTDAVNGNEKPPLWSSSKLSLVSEEFEVPKIKDVILSTSFPESDPLYDGEILAYINAKVIIAYSKTKKISYSNKNIHAVLTIRSIATKKILETGTYELSDQQENIFKTKNKYQYHEPVIVEIELKNTFNEMFYNVQKIYRPHTKWTSSYIKTNHGVKKVKAFYVNLEVGSYDEDERQHEGDWL